MIFMDSNRNHIDWRRFWTVKGSKKKFCGSLYKVSDMIREDEQIRSTKYVVVSVGVNDIDCKSAEEVLHQLQVVIGLLRDKYNNPKIILSEITPQTDDKDEEVEKCNDLINDYVATTDYIFLAKHSNLRHEDGRMFSDAKHITRNAIPIFVTNLKKALREAYGMLANFNRNNRIYDRDRDYDYQGYQHHQQRDSY